MTALRRFSCDDLFTFNNINLDKYTENYGLTFYLQYLVKWPEYCVIAEGGVDKRPMGYIFGKAEGVEENWHGHVTALSVSPDYRRLGLARKLMNILEVVSEKYHNGYFVDLYVRVSNTLAKALYAKLGYTRYRTVLGYYSGSEDAWDMRKALPRDKLQKSLVAPKDVVSPDEVE